LGTKTTDRSIPRVTDSPNSVANKKLSYLEAREYATIEQRIAEAEHVLQSKRADLESPAIATDSARLVAAHAEMQASQKNLDALYARWAELEKKAGSVSHSHTR
jgi:ATP-binding cassette subfamily F protein uup